MAAGCVDWSSDVLLFRSVFVCFFFFFKQKTAYEIYQCDWSSDVCSSDLRSMGQSSRPAVCTIRAKPQVHPDIEAGSTLITFSPWIADNLDMEHAQPAKWILPAIGGVIILVIVVAAALTAGRRVPILDPSTPEGVAQGFVLAVFDDDEPAAFEFLTDELANRCQEAGRLWFPEPGRATIVETKVTDERAVVELEISTVYGNTPFELSESTRAITLVMVRSGSAWRISENPSGWFWCPAGVSQ